MALAQVPLQEDPVRITTNDTNYEFIRETLHPTYYIKTAINLLLGAAGVVSIVYLLWGGIQWITAGGDKDAVEKARKKILNALIGLAIVFSSYAMLYAVRVLFNVNLIQVEIVRLGDSIDSSGGSTPDPETTPGVIPTLPPGCGPCRCGEYHAAIGRIGPVSYGGTCYTCTETGWGPPTYAYDDPVCPDFITCGPTCE